MTKRNVLQVSKIIEMISHIKYQGLSIVVIDMIFKDENTYQIPSMT